MVKLEAGMGWLKRSQKMCDQLGGRDLTIRISRVGNQHEVRAAVAEPSGEFTCRIRQRDWRSAIRELIQRLVHYLHDRRMGLA